MNLRNLFYRLRRPAFLVVGLSPLLALQTVRADRANVINIVGLDRNGQQVVTEISPENYTRTLAAVVTSVQSSIEPTLALHENSAPVSPYELRTVSVGTTISGTAGLGPIWSIGGIARLRLVFSNSTNPVYPD